MITFKKAKRKGFKKERWFILIDSSVSDKAVSGNVVEVNRRDGTSELVKLANLIEVDTESNSSLWTFTKVRIDPAPRTVRAPLQNPANAIQVGSGDGRMTDKLKMTESERAALEFIRSQAELRKNALTKMDPVTNTYRIAEHRDTIDRINLIFQHAYALRPNLEVDEPIGCYRPLINDIERMVKACREHEAEDPDIQHNTASHEVAIALLQDRLNQLGG